jgi:hypothetical protein
VEADSAGELAGPDCTAQVASTGMYYASIKDAVSAVPSSDTIIAIADQTINSTVKVPANKNITLTTPPDKDITLYRGSSGLIITDYTDKGCLFYVNGKGTLTLQGSGSGHIILDGSHGSGVTCNAPLVMVTNDGGTNGGTLNIKDGAVLQNNFTGGTADGAGVYLYAYAVCNMSGGSITGNSSGQSSGAVNSSAGSGIFNMSGGSITNNHAGTNGGALGGYTFNISGGTISGNTAAQQGNGIFVGSVLTLTGGAHIDAGNDVYVAGTARVTIGGTLTGAYPVATITPQAYTAGTQVLTGSVSLVADNYSKFAVTPQMPGSNPWHIDNSGQLQSGAP